MMARPRRRRGSSVLLLDFQIAVSADDGYSNSGGLFSALGIDLRIGNLGGDNYDTFARFPSVNVKQGATVVEAFIQPAGRIASGGAGTRSNIAMEDADDAVAPTSRAEHVADARTTAFTAWDGFTFAEDTYAQSPSIVDVVQEVVDRGSWASGNAMMVLWDNDASDANKLYDCNAVDDASGLSMRLHIGVRS